MKQSDIIKRVDHLISEGNRILGLQNVSQHIPTPFVPQGEYQGFKAGALSGIESIYGWSSTYFKRFDAAVMDNYVYSIESGISILKAIKKEIKSGWLTSLKGIVAAEIFSDFLEMAEYLLNQTYKDAAAVMIGSVLEEHLRRIATNHAIPLTTTNSKGDVVPKKADTINTELTKALVYNKVDNKNVSAWLGIRNSAAHGNYGDYSPPMVQNMHAGVLNFIGRVS